MRFRSISMLPPGISALSRRNFFHLYADTIWFGVLNGSAISFLAVYAARVGATSEQVGIINAAPALMALIFSLPFGAWIEPQSKRRAVFLTAFLMRIYYLPLILIPNRLPEDLQVGVILIMVFLMNIPATGLGVSFNALFAEAVALEHRAQIAGIRNVLFAIVSIVTSIGVGQILNTLTFPTGYQIVFAIGFLSAALSTLHLGLVQPPRREKVASPEEGEKIEFDKEENLALEIGIIQQVLTRIRRVLQLEIVRSPFRTVLWLMFAFHLAQFFPLPLFPIFAVRVLAVPDRTISIANAIFFLAMLIGSSQAPRLVARIGNQKLTGVGLVFLAGYPLVLSLSYDPTPYLAAHLLGGTGWGFASSSMFNFVLEKAKPHTLAAHLAWFNLFANAGILLGSVTGPLVGNLIGIRAALMVFALIRVMTGFNILRWK